MTPVRRERQEWLPSIFSDFFDNDWISRTNTTMPAINVIESDKDYKVEVAAPGMTKEDFSIQMTSDNQIVVSMEKKDEKKDENSKYLHREFSYSKFQQSLIVPDDVEKDLISASVNDGVLTIAMPKKTQEEKANECKMIEIK